MGQGGGRAQRPAVRRELSAPGRLTLAACAALLLACPPSEARYPGERLLAGNAGPSPTQAARPADAQVFVTAVGPGQAGYVHFFELTGPDGEPETQVGIETLDQRIAWSFPGVGAAVVPFIVAGEIEAGGVRYRIEHLYAIKPFRDPARMADLQQALPLRVSLLVDDATRYCNDPESRDRFCMSCLGFVLEVLFPGPHPAPPLLPREFMRSRSHAYYSTEDLLLYLSGIDALPTREARYRRIAQMQIPGSLREDLQELVATIDPAERVPSTRMAGNDARRTVAASGVRTRTKPAQARTGPRRL